MFTCLKTWFQRRRERLAAIRRSLQLKQESRIYNRDAIKRRDFSHWMCPACGTISPGIYHEYAWMSGLKYRACCRHWCFHGGRDFHRSYLPDSIHCDPQPIAEFK